MWFQRGATRSSKYDLLVKGLDKLVFLAVFASGATYILLAKWLGVDQIWVTAVPVLLMLAYAASLFLFRRLRVEAAQAGDNLYYLGFLFTLCSLAVALARLGDGATSQDMIQNFGIALFTTIAGLMLRVLFGQMEHDPIETEREVRLQLVEMASQLRNDIIQVRSSMDVALISVQQQSSEAVARYVKQLDSVVSEFAHKTSDNFKVFSEEAGKFNLISEKLVGSVESLVERVNQVNAPSDLLATKLSPSVDAIAEAADEVRKRAKADKAAVEKLTIAITDLTKVSEEAEARIQGIAVEGARAEETYKRLADIADKFDQAASAARANIEHTHSTMQVFDKLGSTLEAAVTQAGERIVQGADQVVSGQKEMLRKVEEVFSTNLQQIRNHNAALAIELEQSKQYTVKVHSELVTMTQTLTKQVNGEE